ncbi:NAD(P)H-dependent oxidoreductase [Mucilaginibacter sp. Bleaf8]|uniref:NAD(P)H-dependent oxidoreductase n=1 Tax=Mucilaginibacter sp. Bleaf8 TaxID=2834430 RepID=UPI001BD04C22|nr:NAD(P)H-dependent oxidoreductase [Mucilaginibacter sp. Bleaf8]MBS7563828.1 NAD(P)H-dependent oxidoreductase [Mucilaginibacter sp. Bleaf8]
MIPLKTLIIIIHPNLAHSVVNKRWIDELRKFPETYVVHDLYAAYPNGKIDVKSEQQLLEKFDNIVFQFPFFWFNCPPLLKQWLDEVLIYGWAFGANSGYKLSGKKIALAISTGIDKDGYQPTGRYKYTMEHLLAPFELTFDYVRADYRPPFIFYGTELQATTERIDKSAQQYLDYLASL